MKRHLKLGNLFVSVKKEMFSFVVLTSSTTHSRCRGCLFSLDHTQTHTTVGRTPLDEGSARRRDLYLTTQTLNKRKTSMPPVGFEPTIPASARPQTYALDRAATGIGKNENVKENNTVTKSPVTVTSSGNTGNDTKKRKYY
jgi:hypothetical protein